MDPFRPLFIMNLCIPVADDFLLEILPRCAINRDLSWKQSELYYFFFFFKFNWIFHCKQPHFTIYFPKQRDIIVFISDDRHWPSTVHILPRWSAHVKWWTDPINFWYGLVRRPYLYLSAHFKGMRHTLPIHLYIWHSHYECYTTYKLKCGFQFHHLVQTWMNLLTF